MRRLDKGLQAINLMLHQGFHLSEHLIQSLLDKSNDLDAGRFVHCIMCISDPNSVIVSGHLIRLLASFKSLLEANLVFCQVTQPTVHTWQAIISAHQVNGEGFQAIELYYRMVADGIEPNRFVFSCVLRACASIGGSKEGMLIHEHVIKSGLDSDVVVGSTLIDMYGKCRNVYYAHKVFDRLQNRNVVSWNALVAGYVQNGLGDTALKLFQDMQVGGGTGPNKVTFLCALKACSQIGDVRQGKALHQQIINKGLCSDVVIGNTLIDMYSKCGRLDEASRVLNGLLKRNVVSWSAIIAGSAQHGDGLLAIQLYEQMKQEGVNPDRVTLIGFLNACSSIQAIEHGKLVHDQIIKRGFGADLVVRGALIKMYVKCERLNHARKVFDEVSNQTVMLWGTMISGYTQHGQGLIALELYEKMQQGGVKPDKFLFSCLLKACGYLGSLEQGKVLHNQMTKSRVEPDIVIGNALIDMYTRCGDLMEARRVFDKLPCRDVVSWGLMISIHAQQGNGRLAVQCLKDMQQDGIKPNDMLYARLLCACSHAGQVEEGQWQLNSMNENRCFGPSIKHFTCIVDLLGCAGHLEAAKNMLQTMPFSPNIVGWMSLLTGCVRHGNLELGWHCLNQIVQADPQSSSGYVLLSKIYADTHMWNEAHRMQDWRRCVTVS